MASLFRRLLPWKGNAEDEPTPSPGTAHLHVHANVHVLCRMQMRQGHRAVDGAVMDQQIGINARAWRIGYWCTSLAGTRRHCNTYMPVAFGERLERCQLRPFTTHLL